MDSEDKTNDAPIEQNPTMDKTSNAQQIPQLTQIAILPGAIKQRHLVSSPTQPGDTYFGGDGNSFANLSIGDSASIYYSTGTKPAWLAPGSDGQYLGMSGTALGWITPPTQNVGKDGWTAVTDTWTYASATTITVPSGAASVYQVGDKVKLTQTTVKYFIITTVADTLLTVTGGDDYSVANAAITSPSYSHQANPLGFPSGFDYSTSVTITAPSGTAPTFSTKAARFSVQARQCFFTFEFENAAGGTAGSGAVTVYVSLPITAVNTGSNPTGGGLWYNNATKEFLLANPTTSTRMYFRKTSTAVLAAGDFDQTIRQWYGYATFEI